MTVCGRIRLRVLACVALALGVTPLAPFCGCIARQASADIDRCAVQTLVSVKNSAAPMDVT